jgi:hypothetical protein
LNAPNADGRFFVVGCTTQCTDDPNKELELPWKDDRHPLTKLRKRTVAVLDWIEEIRLSDVCEVKGCLPSSVLVELRKRMIRDFPPELREQV